jgi:Xaa-Pro aminopeptidase
VRQTLAAVRPRLDARLARVRERIAADRLHGFLVTSSVNVAYLTGLRASASAVVVTDQSATLVTDFRYRDAAVQRLEREDAPTDLTLQIVDQSYDQTIVDVIRRLDVRRLAIEADNLTVRRFNWLHRTLAGTASLEPTEQIVERLRVVKDEVEIETIREAARRLSEVAGRVWSFVAEGRMERQIAADIDGALLAAGFERPAFETIVASGPNSALPHARPTVRRLGPGEPVLLDFGGVYDGYCVDLTRVGVLGRAGTALSKLHEAVAAAQDAALAVIRPGATASSVDRAARSALEARGFGRDVFGHGTGHGLGLEVHEAPRVAPPGSGTEADTALEAGMVFTVEPGAYVSGIGGIRLEDDVLVTSAGAELLTRVPRELRELR